MRAKSRKTSRCSSNPKSVPDIQFFAMRGSSKPQITEQGVPQEINLPKRQNSSDTRRTEVHALPAVAVFARTATPGRTKTRLIPALGPEGAAEFHRALVSDSLRKVAKLKGKMTRTLFIGDGAMPLSLVPSCFGCRKQSGRNLGARLGNAFDFLLRQHSRALVIGTDSPAITPWTLRVALDELRSVDAVLGPCPDGGYYLIGLRRFARGLFGKVRLGSKFAFEDTLGSLLAHGFSCSVLEPCPDIDRPEDLRKLREELLKRPSARRLMPRTWQFLSSRNVPNAKTTEQAKPVACPGP